MSLNLASGARVLDVRTGGGGALPPIAQAVGMTGSVLAVDNDSTVLALASDYVEQAGIADRVTLQLGDIVEVLADAATTPENAFDAIWAGDVLYPVYFEEPADVVRQMAQALRPGGIIALFYPNYYHATFLPGHSRLERGLCTVSEIGDGAPVDGPRHKGRHLAWLLAAGLDDVSLKMFPRVCFPIDTDPTVRPYIEQELPGARELTATHGAAAGLSTAEMDEIQRLLTPGDPDYILDEPGCFLVHPATLATGRRPVEAPR
ncbi:MAG: methyltransferase domain-containing protein [Pseudonocardiaceae bacterium]